MKNPNPKLIEVFDFETKTVKTMPKAELGPGMYQAYFQGEGTYWINANQVKPAPLRHPPFGPDLRGKIREIRRRLKEVRPMSMKQWEDGFRHDTTPEREIAIWLKIADIYTGHARSRELTLEQKRELFNVILNCSTVSYDQVLNVVNLESLPIKIAQEAMKSWFEVEVQATPAQSADGFSDPLSLEALRDPEIRELVENSSIVWGVDSYTGQRALFYGKETLEGIRKSGVPSELSVISFRYDSHSEQLEFLVAAVMELKGSCCYCEGGQGSSETA